MESQKFIDDRTGEILTTIPLSEIAHFDKYDGLLEAGDRCSDHLIQQAADSCKKESFIEPEKATNAEALGMAISKWSKWTGDTIFEAFINALEDSNYHRDRSDFVLLWNERHGTKFN